MAISIAKNERITPATLQSRQGSISACSPSSRPQMIINFAKLYGLSAIEVKKDNQNDINNMLTKLTTGRYAAVARIVPNSGIYSSNNGHYVTVVGVKDGVNSSNIQESDLLILDSWDCNLERMDTSTSRFMTTGAQTHKSYSGYYLRVLK